MAAAVAVAAFWCAVQASAADQGLAAVRMPSASQFRVRNIDVGEGSGQVAVDPGIRSAWVAAGRLVRISEATQRGNPDSVVLLKESTGAQFGKISVGFYPNLLTVDPSTGNVYVPIVFKNVVTQFHL